MVPVPIPEQVPAKEDIAVLSNTRLGYWDIGGSGETVMLLHPASGSALVWLYQQPVSPMAVIVSSLIRGEIITTRTPPLRTIREAHRKICRSSSNILVCTGFISSARPRAGASLPTMSSLTRNVCKASPCRATTSPQERAISRRQRPGSNSTSGMSCHAGFASLGLRTVLRIPMASRSGQRLTNYQKPGGVLGKSW